MKDVSKQNFSLVIAYLLPGLVALWGVSEFSQTVRLWLTADSQSAPSVAGFLYVTLAALTAGLTLGAIRSVTIDWLHHRTGIQKPEWDFSQFQAKFWAFNQLVESQYCHYQFYAHTALAVPVLVVARYLSGNEVLCPPLLTAIIALEAVLLVVSRETLKTYYTRASDLLGCEQADDKPAAAKSTLPRRRRGATGAMPASTVAESADNQGAVSARPGRTSPWR